jgi:16S rRNA (cytosine967-C5)-methyltransferase
VLAQLLGARRGEMIVDFCAGAGGKTLAIGATMRNTGRLYAFDVSEKRLTKLKPRLARSGLSNVHPVVIAHERDAKVKRLAGKIDRVLVDAPCSGMGTLRRNPDVKWRQQPGGIAEMTEKQASILDGAARLVKFGGRLVYATCSLLDEENDAIVNGFLATHPDFQLVPASQVLAEQRIALEMGDTLKMLPHKHNTDGFFAAVLERKAGAAQAAKGDAADADADIDA